MPSTGQTIVKDLLRGDVTFDNIKMDDQVLFKSDGMPTYHMANVVDDHLMNITHVIRAEEWIPSTPKHIILYAALGWKEPVWVHMPLLRNLDKSKISKRKNDVSLEHYYNEGYLKESMLNFLALMGWHPDGHTEVFTVEEMVDKFDFAKVHLGSPIFDVAKLNWINREHMKNKSLDELVQLATPFYVEAGFNIEAGQLRRVISTLRDGVDTFKDLVAKSSPFLKSSLENFEALSVEDQEKARSIFQREETPRVIEMFLSKLSSKPISTDQDGKSVIEAMKVDLELGPGKILPVIRLLSTGHLKGPETFKVITTIPKDELVRRAKEFLDYVS
jgi:glutamyl-tRNA synthetase